MIVFLFDIDGTLLNTGGAGRAALDAAMRDEFRIASPEQVPLSGRTDRGIASNLFRLHGIADTTDNWGRFRDAYLRWLAEHLPQRNGTVLPGVRELLERLTRRTDAVVGLLTGNVREGARLKLAHYGLDGFFVPAVGGFGDTHPERENVAREALTTVHGHAAERYAIRELWVVGDTPADVRCGQAIGAKTLAVATGGHSRDELAAERPDLLRDDLAGWMLDS